LQTYKKKALCLLLLYIEPKSSVKQKIVPSPSVRQGKVVGQAHSIVPLCCKNRVQRISKKSYNKRRENKNGGECNEFERAGI